MLTHHKHTFKPSTPEAGGSLWVQDQPGLHRAFQASWYYRGLVSKRQIKAISVLIMHKFIILVSTHNPHPQLTAPLDHTVIISASKHPKKVQTCFSFSSRPTTVINNSIPSTEETAFPPLLWQKVLLPLLSLQNHLQTINSVRINCNIFPRQCDHVEKLRIIFLQQTKL